jgi:hypothetical protein
LEGIHFLESERAPHMGTKKPSLPRKRNEGNQHWPLPSSCLWRDSCPRTSAGLDEREKAGLLTPRSLYSLRLTILADSGSEVFVARYSGATARDLHPLPYSPLAVAKGTLSRFYTTYCVVIQRTAQVIVVEKNEVKTKP